MSPTFLSDENIDGVLIQRLRRRGVDIVRVQDVGLRTKDDATILRWAAAAGRILVTRDVKTIPLHATARILAGELLTGVLLLPLGVSNSVALDDISLIAQASQAHEWIDRIVYLPLK